MPVVCVACCGFPCFYAISSSQVCYKFPQILGISIATSVICISSIRACSWCNWPSSQTRSRLFRDTRRCDAWLGSLLSDKLRPSLTSVRKSSTEEILSHSVSETTQQVAQLLQAQDISVTESPSIGLDGIYKAIRQAAQVPDVLSPTPSAERLLPNFTPEQKRIFVATFMKENRRFAMTIIGRIFNWGEGLLDDNGNIEEDIREELQNVIKELDEDQFAPDVKEMMLEIALSMVKKHPKFCNKLAERTVHEIFNYMSIPGSTWHMTGSGGLNRKMLILFMNAYNKFIADDGPDRVVKTMYKAFPLLTLRLSLEYGRKYKTIVQKLAKEGKLTVEKGELLTVQEMEEKSATASSKSASKSASGASVSQTGTAPLSTPFGPQMSKEEMGQF